VVEHVDDTHLRGKKCQQRSTQKVEMQQATEMDNRVRQQRIGASGLRVLDSYPENAGFRLA
jgi:hypothetical protein